MLFCKKYYKMTASIDMITKTNTLYKVHSGAYTCNMCNNVIDKTKEFYIPLICIHAFCSECVKLINDSIVVNRKTNERIVLQCPKESCQKVFTKIIKCNFIKQSVSKKQEDCFTLVEINNH